jgi:AraC-like DNA-binding protein
MLIEKYFLKEKSVAFYADQLSIHPNYLNSICKEETSNTASELIGERVLAEAKSLLYQTELSVKEIAYYLQFKDTSHFYKFFKKATRQTPLNYRLKTKRLV